MTRSILRTYAPVLPRLSVALLCGGITLACDVPIEPEPAVAVEPEGAG